ncbi:unnamed protein product, partial [Staurois parvus]
MEHSGYYKCRASTGDTSEVVTLSVSHGPVILRAPLYVYEGDNISLQCYSPPELLAMQTIFYRNNQTLWKSSTNYTLQLTVKHTDLTATYRCSKHFPVTKTYSAGTTISYTEMSGTVPVTITPNWNKLLTGENISMTCHGETYLTYHWFHNGGWVAEGQIYTITSVQVGHSGFYQCRTNQGVSLIFSLEVSHGPVILQAPFFVYRGRNINLKCHSHPDYSVNWTTLYRNNRLIYGPSRDLSFPFLEGNYDWSGTYRCERTLSREEYVTYTDEVSLHVRDLFTKPNITTTLYTMTEGDNMTLTCET